MVRVGLVGAIRSALDARHRLDTLQHAPGEPGRIAANAELTAPPALAGRLTRASRRTRAAGIQPLTPSS
jgi:predicted RNA polymerase sigma factor